MTHTDQSFEAEQQFDRSFELLQQLVNFEDANELFAQRAHTVYNACVVLWMLVYQRLKPDASLENAVKHLLDTRPNYLPKNKRLDDNTISTESGSYSRARSRLPLQVVRWFAEEVSSGIISITKPTVNGRRVFLIDGTTMTLAPEKELQQAFPPASNQLGEGVWPCALLTVFHELASGAAMLPQVGAMYGPKAVSETQLARQGFELLPSGSIIMSDAGFGIFGVAHAATDAGHDILLRMKKANFQSLQKKAELTEQSEHHKSYRHTWIPTKKNRQTQPELAEDCQLEVYLHEVHVSETLTLYLVSTLTLDAFALAALFERRYDVEVDIRNFKVVMDAENIRAKSVDTFMKELYTSVVAYNLTSQLRIEAAGLEEVEPRRMSFKRTWTTFQTFLLRHMHTEPAQWRAAYRRALSIARRDKLPVRGKRNYRREAYRKRPKDVQFEKRTKPSSKLKDSDLK
jgi:hypothetical protein